MRHAGIAPTLAVIALVCASCSGERKEPILEIARLAVSRLPK